MSKDVSPLQVWKDIQWSLRDVAHSAKVIIETALKNYDMLLEEYNLMKKEFEEQQEIANHYGWNTITNEIFDVKTDKKYQDLFSSAIIDIQKDYRKARALDIIKEKKVNVGLFLIGYKELDYQTYKEHLAFGFQIVQQVSEKPLTEEEFDTLKRELL